MTQHTRRQFLAGSTGLVIAVALPLGARAQSGAAAALQGAGTAEGTFAPNAFVRVAPDNTVTVLIKHIEFGQGPYTGLSTLVAEEMDADWSQMRAEAAPANDELYANLLFGMQGTGGSTAMANSYTQMRKAGAAARAMLVAAAAEEWGVPAEEITVEQGVLSHPGSGQSAKLRRAGRGRGEPDRPRGSAAEGSVPVPADRHRRAEARQRGQDPRDGDLHPRRLSRRHADRRGAPPAQVRRNGGQLRRFRGA